MEQNIEHQTSKENDSINLRAELEKYLVYWKWFLLSVMICGGLAIFYAKTKVNIFETNTSVLVKDKGGPASELMVFQDLSSLGAGGNNVADEIEVLNSRSLADSYAKKLNLNVEIFQKKGLKNVELFTNRPFEYKILSDKSNFFNLDTVFNIKIKSNSNFEYKLEGLDEFKKVKFGEKIKIGSYEFLLIPKFSEFDQGFNNSYKLKFTNINKTIEKYRRIIKAKSADKSSNIIKISLNHPVKLKAQLVLNTMVSLYNQMSIDDKNLIGQKTDDFITRRLDVIKEELDKIDILEENYKSNKQITDLSIQSKAFFDSKSINQKEIYTQETQLHVVNFMLDDIKKQQNNFELLPTNISVDKNPQLSVSVSKYNELLFERNRLLRGSSLSNPVVQSLNIELVSLRENIKNSLVNSKKQLEISLNSLNTVEKNFDNKISALPKQAREYRSILRRQSIIAELYAYLLQKKEENEISMAVTISNSKVIDRAYSNANAVAPKKIIILLVGLILGVLIPFIIIYITDLLDTKFHTKKDLVSNVSVPFIGDIPLDKSEEKVVIKKGSRTSTAEAFRLLRTNLDFMLSSVTEKSKIIFVTSTISGEGKTYVSVNTAASLALTGKKVLLVGMDLRAPKITQYLGLPNKEGVTNYLISKDSRLEDITFALSNFENLDLLSSGLVPPNPAELLMSPKIKEMFDELKKTYDYIVVDTAPVNLVTDTLMLSKYADMFLYVSRANYLDKRLLDVPERLYKEKRLPNMAILMNGIDYSKRHGKSYGYGYGYYGGGEEKQSFFKKIFNR